MQGHRDTVNGLLCERVRLLLAAAGVGPRNRTHTERGETLFLGGPRDSLPEGRVAPP